MVQPKRTVGEHRGRLRADLKAGRVADCHEGARCCGECCIGSSVQVTFPYGSELTGEYSGSYNGTVVAFAAPVAVTSTNWAANSEMSRILVQYDNPKDEVKKWAFWPRRGDQPGGCGYTASASLSEIGDSRGPMAGRQRWEYAHSVTAADLRERGARRVAAAPWLVSPPGPEGPLLHLVLWVVVLNEDPRHLRIGGPIRRGNGHGSCEGHDRA